MSSRSTRFGVRALPFVLLIVTLACSLPAIGRQTPTPAPTSQPLLPTTPPTLPPPAEPLPPALVETSPPPGAEIPLQGEVTLYFNQPMDRASVESDLAGQLEAQPRFRWVDDATLSVSPAAPLQPEQALNLQIGASARSAQGLSFTQPVSLAFQAAGFLRPAQLLPEPGAADIDPTSAVVASFTRPVVPLGAGAAAQPPAFTVTIGDSAPAAGRGEWSSTSTYIFYPEPALQGGNTYTVAIDPNLRAADGSPLQPGSDPSAPALSWSFTTALPQIVSIEPASGSAAVRLDAPVVVTFNQPMDAASVEAGWSLAGPGGAPVSGSFTWNDDGSQVTFRPAGLLARSTPYSLSIPGSVQGLGGTPLNTPASATFTTSPALAVTRSQPSEGGILPSGQGVTLVFSAPLDESQAQSAVQINPSVPNLQSFWNEAERSLFVNGDFAPNTAYTLTLPVSLPDAWGGVLGQDYTLNFRTAPLDPGLVIPAASDVLFMTPQDASLPVQATNLFSVPLTQGSVPLDDFLNLLAPDGYERRQAYQPANARTWAQALSLEPDRTQAAELYLTPDQQPLPPGLYLLRVGPLQTGQPANPLLVVVSNVQVTLKASATAALVWAVDVRSSNPLANAPVSLRDEKGNELAAGKTGGDGIFEADIPTQSDPYAQLYAIVGEPGSEIFSLGLIWWNQGLNSWDFGLPSDPSGPRLEVYLYSDRPIYRPGQTVYFRAVARQAYNGRYQMPDLKTLPLALTGDSGQPLATFDLPLSAFGTAHGEYTLPDDAAPGYYALFNEQARSSALSFQLAEYRKPEINLQVAFDRQQALAGDTLNAAINARYFFDAPAGNLPVQWALYAAPSFFDLPGYSVGAQDTSWLAGFDSLPAGNPLGAPIDQGQARTAPDGTLALQLPARQETTRQRYTLEATITDESGLPVSARASIEVNPAGFYVGVRPESWVGRAGELLGFEVQAVDWEGNPGGSRALRAEFNKVVWVRRDPANAPGSFPAFTPQYTPVGSTDFKTSDAGQARLAFTPPEPGTYLLRVAGEGAATETLTWVGGAGQAVWPNLPNGRLRLTADRAAYQPGDTARVFIPNPFGAAARALVSLERSTLLRHQIIPVDPGGATLELPLSADDAPNLYVSVTLLGQSGQQLDFRQGLVELPVEPVEQALIVSLASQPERAGPGDEVTFSLLVTDSFGDPVQGEFSLAVVDLAALALAGPNAPGIVQAFYRPQPLGVRTALSLAGYGRRLVSGLPDGRGGGGGEAAPQVVREEFPDTAYWNAEIVTGPDGKAQVSLRLPDSLTTWQVDLRGVDEKTRVGEAQSQVVATQDLLVRPVTPRFLVVDDHAQLAAVVQNNTTGDLQVEVSLQAAGFRLDDPSQAAQVVSVTAGGRVRVSWWGTVEDETSADLVFSARAGDLQDAARPAAGNLPILRYTARQAFSASGILPAGAAADELSRLELVSLPRSFDPHGGELSLELSPSLAASLLQEVQTLEARPYDSTEEIVSRFLPALEAYLALKEFNLEAPGDKDRLDTAVQTGLNRLAARQSTGGGWAWWPGDSGEGDRFVTAYALLGLARARDAGYRVDDALIDGARDFLWANPPDPRTVTEGWQLDRIAFEYYALSHVNTGDLTLTGALYEQRDLLSPWAKALLALAEERLSPGSQRAKTLISELESAAVRSATGAHWEAGATAGPNLANTLAGSAIVLYALAQRDPGSPLVAEALRYLALNRQAQGGWGASFASAWSVMALSQAVRGTGELGGSFAFSATLNGSPFASGQASGAGQLNPVRVEAPLSQLYPDMPNALQIQREPGPGRLYYRAALQISQPVDSVSPLEAGMSVTRLYYPANGECPGPGCSPISAARPGDQVTVRLTLTLPHDSYHVVVEDYIPAGAEILNTRLKTSQQGEGGVPQAAGVPQAVGAPQYDPRRPFAGGWGWWLFHPAQVRDERITWAADALPAGTYELTYTLVILQPGEYRVLPARAWEFYFPETQGNSAGDIFAIQP